MAPHLPLLTSLAAAIGLVCSLGGCSGLADGDWPSLRTPGAPMQGTSPQGAQTQASPAGGWAAPASGQLAALAARLDEERRALETSSKRWETQSSVFSTAAAAARDAPAGSVAWATAQTELTRLNQIAAAFADSLVTVNQTAGRLAALQAQGQDVAAALGDAGRLVLRLEAAIAANEKAMVAAQAQLAR